MRRSRRRTRREDPLASAEAVRSVLLQLRRRCPKILPAAERNVAKLLESVRHGELKAVIDQTKGRPRRWPREDVAEVAQNLREILEHKTGGRISLSSFVSTYLPILGYPTEVVNALREGKINIREAAYLGRLRPEALDVSARDARRLRVDIIKAHLVTNGSQESLRQRVKTALGESSVVELRGAKSGRQIADELVEKNPYDPRHLFFEEIQQLSDAMSEVRPENLSGKMLVQVLEQVNRLLCMLRQVTRGVGRGSNGNLQRRKKGGGRADGKSRLALT